MKHDWFPSPTILLGVSDSDFAGLVRQNRERLGLTTSRVAELIGRSPGTVRAWEKGTTRPSEDSVVSSLAAVLGIDEGVLFDAAGLEAPIMEHAPSIRQALSTLIPRPDRSEDVQPERAREPEPVRTALDQGEDEETELAEPAATTISHGRQRGRSSFADRLRAATVRRAPRPAGAPSTLPPVPMAPSYMEDANERWSYRLRGIYTAVGVVLMFIVLGWAASNLFDSVGELWSELTANF